LDKAALAKRRWGRWIYRSLLPSFSTLWAQNAETRDGLMALGAPAERVVITGTIKSMSPPLACDTDQLHAWERILGNRPVWLLASSHPGEEALALQVHGLLRHQHPEALLVITPRAPARGSEVLNLCPSHTLLRSTSNALPNPSDAVYVADTIGEMGLWYRLAPVTMLGGSWAQVGGHNPHEPLALGCCVLHGPHVWNFAESYSDFDAHSRSHLVMDAKSIAQAISTVWAHPSLRATNHSPTAWKHVESLIQQAKCAVPPDSMR
jgi:3-deoxy-D-manno-octulosonic-acid transferase